ncbi:SRPBCC family protein [Quadrisphaera setariae]|uniref:SRPBCC domain-containing protein n=1 Tax=Quadrisphaera setariae TaxID=2593304 RepID=A0A5C8Z6G2_9ACTN|nr:SRPBCC domain-containing protein [Quadrisphaera setariae]TXR52520.1 SRPBCC domain-containing protein [Quadrisphaera setariae]
MTARPIDKTIDIAAPPQRVWEVLFGDATYREWTSVFAEGSYADTDWREGSTVRFLGPEGGGMLGRIVVGRPHELLDVEYDGFVSQGRVDTDSDAAREYRGTHESYRLEAVDAGTHLAVSAPVGEEHYDAMVGAWDDALTRVKQLAEADPRG